jgi:hypothetical protein
MQSEALRARQTVGAYLLGPGQKDKSVAAFLELVGRSHTNRRIKLDALQTLAYRYPDRGMALLDILTKDATHPEMQRQVVRLLVGLADGAGLDKLIKIAEAHPNIIVR